jgi:hypothetical protein
MACAPKPKNGRLCRYQGGIRAEWLAAKIAVFASSAAAYHFRIGAS